MIFLTCNNILKTEAANCGCPLFCWAVFTFVKAYPYNIAILSKILQTAIFTCPQKKIGLTSLPGQLIKRHLSPDSML
jgi:hypothetical protein